MRSVALALGFASCLVLAGCGGTEREWMKVGQTYTTADFRRDYSECTTRGKLDEECMRGRGWVSVTPKTEKAPEEPAMRRPYGYGNR